MKYYFVANGSYLISNQEMLEAYADELFQSNEDSFIREQSFEDWKHNDIFATYEVKNSDRLRRGHNRIRLYFDIETREVITEYQLRKEYESEAREVSFPQYIVNCLTASNGTLEMVLNDREIRLIK